MLTVRRALMVCTAGILSAGLACSEPEVMPSAGGGGGTGGLSIPGGGGRGGGGGGLSIPPGGGGGGGGAGPIDMGMEKCGKLVAVVRDFQDSHPDFEEPGPLSAGRTSGIVRTELDQEGKPLFAEDNPNALRSVSGKASFDQWYRDVDGVNMKMEVDLPLLPLGPGTFFFESSAAEAQFFPFDDKGFGNQGRVHNYHFTTEIRATFKYRGGEKFKFKGDDDLWIFVNNKLALDIGGVHGAVTGEIDFDAKAAELGITKGNMYNFDVFHAERHTMRSNFRVETSIDCLQRRIE